jgi:hypothetical protein
LRGNGGGGVCRCCLLQPPRVFLFFRSSTGAVGRWGKKRRELARPRTHNLIFLSFSLLSFSFSPAQKKHHGLRLGRPGPCRPGADHLPPRARAGAPDRRAGPGACFLESSKRLDAPVAATRRTSGALRPSILALPPSHLAAKTTMMPALLRVRLLGRPRAVASAEEGMCAAPPSARARKAARLACDSLAPTNSHASTQKTHTSTRQASPRPAQPARTSTKAQAAVSCVWWRGGCGCRVGGGRGGEQSARSGGRVCEPSPRPTPSSGRDADGAAYPYPSLSRLNLPVAFPFSHRQVIAKEQMLSSTPASMLRPGIDDPNGCVGV